MVWLMCVVNFAITLLDGWLQSRLHRWEDRIPPRKSRQLGAGLSHESLVQRNVTRFFLVMS